MGFLSRLFNINRSSYDFNQFLFKASPFNTENLTAKRNEPWPSPEDYLKHLPPNVKPIYRTRFGRTVNLSKRYGVQRGVERDYYKAPMWTTESKHTTYEDALMSIRQKPITTYSWLDGNGYKFRYWVRVVEVFYTTEGFFVKEIEDKEK